MSDDEASRTCGRSWRPPPDSASGSSRDPRHGAGPAAPGRRRGRAAGRRPDFRGAGPRRAGRPAGRRAASLQQQTGSPYLGLTIDFSLTTPRAARRLRHRAAPPRPADDAVAACTGSGREAAVGRAHRRGARARGRASGEQPLTMLVAGVFGRSAARSPPTGPPAAAGPARARQVLGPGRRGGPRAARRLARRPGRRGLRGAVVSEWGGHELLDRADADALDRDPSAPRLLTRARPRTAGDGMTMTEGMVRADALSAATAGWPSPSTCRGTAPCRSPAWSRVGSPSTARRPTVLGPRRRLHRPRRGRGGIRRHLGPARRARPLLDAAGRPGDERAVEVALAVRIPYIQQAPGVAARAASGRPNGRNPPMTRLTVGDPAPPFELPDPEGNAVGLDPARAAATVVVFTANGCPYARAWHDRIQDVARDYADRGVTVLQVVSNDDADHPEDSVEAMRQRVAAGDFAGPLLHDADQSVAQAYGATATPRSSSSTATGSSGTTARRTATTTTRRRTRPGCARRSTTCWPAARSPGRPPRRRAARSSGGWSCSGGRAARPTARRPTCWRRRSTSSEGRRARRPARGAHARRGPAARLPRLTHVPGGRPRPVPDRRAAGAHLPRLRSGPTAAARPLPDAADLAARLRDVLARPWELPGWVDFRAAPLRHLVLTHLRHPEHCMASITFDRITKRYPDGTQAVSELDLESATASSSSWSVRRAAARRRRCAWRPGSRRSPPAGC